MRGYAEPADSETEHDTDAGPAFTFLAPPSVGVGVALVHIALGETDRTFEWLEKAIEARDWQMGLLNVEPAFDPLRSDPRFAALVERVGLPR